jgi:predicted RNase H-like HicB family nuclease
MKSNFTFTAIIEKDDDGWYVGQLEEMPEVLSQGKTVKELISNLKDALNLILEDRKETIIKSYSGKKIIRRKVSIA